MSKEALAPLVSYVEKSTVHNGRDVHSFGVWNYSSGTMDDIIASKRFEISERSLSPRSRPHMPERQTGIVWQHRLQRPPTVACDTSQYVQQSS
eukprot:gene20200-biopygen2553